jgi:hypothetical protein
MCIEPEARHPPDLQAADTPDSAAALHGIATASVLEAPLAAINDDVGDALDASPLADRDQVDAVGVDQAALFWRIARVRSSSCPVAGERAASALRCRC